MSTRYFKYTGEPWLTRGDYGVDVVGGHTTDDDPGGIYVFDPDCGDTPVVSVVSGLESGEWIEITRREWEALQEPPRSL